MRNSVRVFLSVARPHGITVVKVGDVAMILAVGLAVASYAAMAAMTKDGVEVPGAYVSTS